MSDTPDCQHSQHGYNCWAPAYRQEISKLRAELAEAKALVVTAHQTCLRKDEQLAALKAALAEYHQCTDECCACVRVNKPELLARSENLLIDQKNA